MLFFFKLSWPNYFFLSKFSIKLFIQEKPCPPPSFKLNGRFLIIILNLWTLQSEEHSKWNTEKNIPRYVVYQNSKLTNENIQNYQIAPNSQCPHRFRVSEYPAFIKSSFRLFVLHVVLCIYLDIQSFTCRFQELLTRIHYSKYAHNSCTNYYLHRYETELFSK